MGGNSGCWWQWEGGTEMRLWLDLVFACSRLEETVGRGSHQRGHCGAVCPHCELKEALQAHSTVRTIRGIVPCQWVATPGVPPSPGTSSVSTCLVLDLFLTF